ncbi:MAG TPA: hypothetical protein VF941_02880 [Clostridia bacterium]
MAEFYDPLKHLGDPLQHQKMYDFERDILRVKNPLNTEFTFYYDLLPHTIPVGATKDMERYLVRNFIFHMMQHIYNQMATHEMEEKEQAFRKMHPDTIEDPYLRNTQIYDKMKRFDDPTFQQQVVKDCILGVVKKFGRDRVLPPQQKQGSLDPNTPLYMSLIDKFSTQLEDIPAQPEHPVAQEAIQPLG